MFEGFDGKKITIKPSLDVYLPWENHISRIDTINDAIVIVRKAIWNDPDSCWDNILGGLIAVNSAESAGLMRWKLRTEFLLRGMTLPEDVNPGQRQQKARSWWHGMIDSSSQLEIELPRPLHA